LEGEFSDGRRDGRGQAETRDEVLMLKAIFASVNRVRSCQGLNNLEVATVGTVGGLHRYMVCHLSSRPRFGVGGGAQAEFGPRASPFQQNWCPV